MVFSWNSSFSKNTILNLYGMAFFKIISWKYHTVHLKYHTVLVRYGIFLKHFWKIPYRTFKIPYCTCTVWYFKKWFLTKYHTVLLEYHTVLVRYGICQYGILIPYRKNTILKKYHTVPPHQNCCVQHYSAKANERLIVMCWSIIG